MTQKRENKEKSFPKRVEGTVKFFREKFLRNAGFYLTFFSKNDKIFLVRFVRTPLAPEEGRDLAVSILGGNSMKDTFMANSSNITRKWYVVDAEGKTLGRLAAAVAEILRGKNKVTFTPHVDTGDYVIVVNADKVVLTGKKLTKKYNLYFANGKERVKQHRLKEPDKTKYGLYSILKSEVSRCGNWNILAANLKKQGVDMRFKYKGKSDEVQGVVFTMNGYSFSGSKIDRRFSFSKIDAALERNRRTERMNMQPPSRHEELPTFQPESRGNDDLYNGSIGLFMPDNADGQAEENRFEEELKRRNKKKKQRWIIMKFTRSLRTSRMTSRASTESWRTLQK